MVSLMDGFCNPLTMMAMQPQTLEQYRNRQMFASDLQMNQINFMGNINPLLSTSRDLRMDMTKSLFSRQADFSEAYSPFSSGNMFAKNKMTNILGNNQGNMISNPFAMGLGYPIMV